MTNSTNNKVKRLPIEELLIKYEKWFREHNKKLTSFFKILEPDSKAIQLTFDSKFHALVKKMHDEDSDCKMLKTLLGDQHLKVKSSYLASNNINALSLEKDSKGEYCIGYKDFKQNLSRELYALKNWEGKIKFLGNIDASKKMIEDRFKILKGSDADKYETLIEDTGKSQSFAMTLIDMKDMFNAKYRELLYEPFRGSDSTSTPTLVGYISNLSMIEEFVGRILYAMYNVFRYGSNAIIGEGNDIKYYFPEEDQRKAIRSAFTDIFHKDNTAFKMVETLVFFYNQQFDLLKKFTTDLDKYKNITDVLKAIEVLNEESIINMLAVAEEFLKLNDKLYHAKQTFEKIKGRRSQAPRNIFMIFDLVGLTRYDYCTAQKSMGIREYFVSSMYLSNNGITTFDGRLNNDIRNFTKNLYNGSLRETAKIGKLSSKLFNGHYKATEVEEVASLFKKHVNAESKEYNIQEVSGDLITYYYNRNTYTLLKGCPSGCRSVQTPTDDVIINAPTEMERGDGCGGSLYNSCMRSPSNYDEIKLYAESPDSIKMIVAFDAENRVAARAILWITLGGTKFIDRVYAANEKVRLAMFAYGEKHGYININGTNTRYSKRLRISSLQGGVVVLDKTPDMTPFLDSVHTIKNSNRRLMGIGNLSTLQKTRGMKRIAEIDAAKAEAKKKDLLEPINVTMYPANADIKKTFSKFCKNKSFELSKEYDFELSITTRITDEPPRGSSAFGYIKDPKERALRNMLYGMSKSSSSNENYYDNRLYFRLKANKFESSVSMPTRYVKPADYKSWVEQKSKQKVDLMNFLGATNYKRAS